MLMEFKLSDLLVSQEKEASAAVALEEVTSFSFQMLESDSKSLMELLPLKDATLITSNSLYPTTEISFSESQVQPKWHAK